MSKKKNKKLNFKLKIKNKMIEICWKNPNKFQLSSLRFLFAQIKANKTLGYG